MATESYARAHRATALAAALAVALAIGGCGSSSSGGSSTSGRASTSAGGGGGSSSSTTADAAQRCLTKAGFDVRPSPPTGPEMTAILYINRDKLNQVYVAFIKTPSAAAKVQKALAALAKRAGGHAGAEVVGGNIVLARAHDTSNPEIARVKRCLPS